MSPPQARPPFFLPALLPLFLVLSLLLAGAAPAAGKGIHVTVQAPWTETSLLQEGCEWAARSFGAEGFYRCLEVLRTAGAEARASTPAAQFATLKAAVVDAWSQTGERVTKVSPGQGALFEVEMAARVYSPAVEAHYTLAELAAATEVGAEDSEADSEGASRVCTSGAPFAVVARPSVAGARVVGDPATLAAALAAAAEAPATPRACPPSSSCSDESVVPGLDHVHPLSTAEAPSGVHVTLYGLVGEQGSMALYDTVVAHLSRTREVGGAGFTFVFRHLPVDPSRLCRSAHPLGHNTTAEPVGSAGLAWTARPLYVQGYGATVDLKNTEYKVVNEKKGGVGGAGARGGPAGTEDEPATTVDTDGADTPGAHAAIEAGSNEIGGFDVDRLKHRHPALAMQLDAFASAMEDELGREETKVDLDAVETQNIGLAAAQYVLEAPLEERLAVLADVVQRFPSYAARLGRLATQATRLSGLQELMSRNPYEKLPAMDAAMFVNGVQLPTQNLSLFGVLERLRGEEAVLATARRALTVLPPAVAGEGGGGETAAPVGHRFIPVDDEGAAARALVPAVWRAQRQLRQNAARHPFVSARVAVPLHAVTWLNDVETDAALEGLSRALSTAFQVLPSGVRLMPRRNIVHAMVFVNAEEALTWRTLSQFASIVSQGAFVRIGVAFVDHDWSTTVTAEMPVAPTAGASRGASTPAGLTAATVAAVFHRAAEAGQTGLLGELCMELEYASRMGQLSESVFLTAAVAVGLVEEGVTAAELVASADFQLFYTEQQSTLRRLGLGPARGSAPEVFVNGARVAAGHTVRNTFDVIMTETEHVRRLIATKALTDKMDDLYGAVLALEGASDHAQPALEEHALAHVVYDSVELMYFLHLQPFLHPSAEATGASAAESRAKAPLVATTTPLTSVLVLPVDLALTDAVAVLRAALQSHAALPFTAEEMATMEGAGARQTGARRRAQAKVIEGGGAARLSVLFASPAEAGAGAAASPRARRGSVQASVEVLLAHDAAVEKRTGRESRLLARYVEWVGAAVSAAPGPLATRPMDDPGVEAALAQAGAPPSDIAAVLSAPDAAAVLSDGATALAKAQAAFRDAVCTQVPKALGRRGAEGGPRLRHPLLVVNGRVVLMDRPASFTAGDLRHFLRTAARPASIVSRCVSTIGFMQLSPDGATDGFRADDLSADFFAAKSVALESVLTAHGARMHGSALTEMLGAGVPLREEDVLPSQQSVGDLVFTVEPSTTAAGPTSGTTRIASRGGRSTPGGEGGFHRITIVVDPAAREAQLVVALAEYLMRSSLPVSVTVYLKPSLQVLWPIRDLYTLVASPTLSFDADNGHVVPPAAVFRALPTQALLTLGIEEPNSWTVFAHEAEQDLDNIILARLPRHQQFVSATYRIQSLIVAGSAMLGTPEADHMAPAEGLPLQLRPRSAAAAPTDTLVMETLGYYQLQAPVGLSYLSVQPGRFASSYFIAGVDGEPERFLADVVTPAGELRHGVNVSAGQRVPVLISTFSGLSLDVYVRPVPADGPQPSILNIAMEQVRPDTYVWPPPPSRRGDGAPQDRPVKPTLNIFSVASGHLYERFLRMMMHSVHNSSSDKYGANTTRIKFWVISNFLSPKFKQYVPLLAKSLGFEVGFVTYRWPWWLKRQTEKQRKIWAYKILFLDVIFPLDVERVIFVDADQTARADLHELYNLNMGNDPVAMTPFCEVNKNEATTGFRFWTQGFWTSHLRGKPYHISAIFLIDLHRFRAMGAGDIYRSTYASLVRDPNSLANLDQDLPNYVQHQVPIFSLPEEWLWCETWCNQESKSRAKTIDLCNNPLTKMPKLDNAKMIVPGWEDVDDYLEDLAVTLTAAVENAQGGE